MSQVKNRKCIESFLLVCAIVAASMAVILPLTAPKVKAQVTHLGSIKYAKSCTTTNK